MITVITPTYNTGHFLDSCIESVRKSLRDLPYEHLIRDDGSHDLVDRTNNSTTKLIHSPVNEGLGSNLLHLIDLVRSEWFIWLNADDLLIPGIHDLVTRALIASDDCGALVGDTIFVDSELKPLRLLGSYPCSLRSTLDAGAYASPGSIIFRTRAVRGFCDLGQFSHLADRALLSEVLRGGWRVENLPAPVSMMRRHANQLSIRVDEASVQDEVHRFSELFSISGSLPSLFLRGMKVHHRIAKLRSGSYMREFMFRLRRPAPPSAA